MARLIHEKIKQPLANEILFGKLASGGSVEAIESGGEILLVTNHSAGSHSDSV